MANRENKPLHPSEGKIVSQLLRHLELYGDKDEKGNIQLGEHTYSERWVELLSQKVSYKVKDSGYHRLDKYTIKYGNLVITDYESFITLGEAPGLKINIQKKQITPLIEMLQLF